MVSRGYLWGTNRICSAFMKGRYEIGERPGFCMTPTEDGKDGSALSDGTCDKGITK